MRFRKAIARKFNIYVTLLSFVTIIGILNQNSPLQHIAAFVLLALACLPLIMLIDAKKKKLFIQFGVYMIIIVGTIGLSFRYLRDLLPGPIVTDNTSIGYMQYYQYPFYLDAVLFNMILLAPLLFFLIKHHFDNMINKNEKRK